MLASAKLNLFLHIGPIRPDRYHDVDSLVVFTEFGDDVRIEPSTDIELSIDGPFAAGLQSDNEDNLVLRAAHLLEAKTGSKKGAHLTLEKNIPIAAGVGGGSSDAAATLRGLNEFWSLGLGDNEILELAEALGADVPVCFRQNPAWMEGIGEILSEGPSLPLLHLLLVNPNIPLSTGKVFATFDESAVIAPLRMEKERPRSFGSTVELVSFLNDHRNDLEAPAIHLCPEIEEVKSSLEQQGSTFTRMSGSGPTCFGVFDSGAAAEAAAKELQSRHPQWWIKPTRTFEKL